MKPRPTREQLAARAAGPGGMKGLRELRDHLEKIRSGCVQKMETSMAEMQAMIDELDGALADIAAVLGELQA